MLDFIGLAVEMKYLYSYLELNAQAKSLLMTMMKKELHASTRAMQNVTLTLGTNMKDTMMLAVLIWKNVV